MRVIAGSLKGRHFDAPPGHRTHPMSDRVRGALFNALGDVEGLTFLDAFTGSGACSFEAISRGAGAVVALDIDKSAINTVVKNARTLGVDKHFKATQANASGWLRTQPNQYFDVILCDPPYDDLQLNLVQSLSERVVPGGLLVLSWPGKQESPMLEGMEVAHAKSYGDAQLVFYRRVQANS